MGRELALDWGVWGQGLPAGKADFFRATGSQVVSPPSLGVCKPTLDNHFRNREGVDVKSVSGKTL